MQYVLLKTHIPDESHFCCYNVSTFLERISSGFWNMAVMICYKSVSKIRSNVGFGGLRNSHESSSSHSYLGFRALFRITQP